VFPPEDETTTKEFAAVDAAADHICDVESVFGVVGTVKAEPFVLVVILVAPGPVCDKITIPVVPSLAAAT
jgi:hypothetical protein